MKEQLKHFLKYVLMVALFFFIIMAGLVFYYLYPVRSTGMEGEQLGVYMQSLVKTSFLHSLTNSLFLSTFIYGLYIFAFQRKKRIITLVMPLIYSFLLFTIVCIVIQPDSTDLHFHREPDARIFFPDKSFFDHAGNKYYFDGIGQSTIEKVIEIDEGEINFYKDASVLFLEDTILVTWGVNGRRMEVSFPRYELQQFNSFLASSHSRWFTQVGSFSYKFVLSRNILINGLLLVSVLFLSSLLMTWYSSTATHCSHL
jgi:hypothetical protein